MPTEIVELLIFSARSSDAKPRVLTVRKEDGKVRGADGANESAAANATDGRGVFSTLHRLRIVSYRQMHRQTDRPSNIQTEISKFKKVVASLSIWLRLPSGWLVGLHVGTWATVWGACCMLGWQCVVVGRSGER